MSVSLARGGALERERDLAREGPQPAHRRSRHAEVARDDQHTLDPGATGRKGEEDRLLGVIEQPQPRAHVLLERQRLQADHRRLRQRAGRQPPGGDLPGLLFAVSEDRDPVALAEAEADGDLAVDQRVDRFDRCADDLVP